VSTRSEDDSVVVGEEVRGQVVDAVAGLPAQQVRRRGGEVVPFELVPHVGAEESCGRTRLYVGREVAADEERVLRRRAHLRRVIGGREQEPVGGGRRRHVAHVSTVCKGVLQLQRPSHELRLTAPL
jgi:hypothetical protein